MATKEEKEKFRASLKEVIEEEARKSRTAFKEAWKKEFGGREDA